MVTDIVAMHGVLQTLGHGARTFAEREAAS